MMNRPDSRTLRGSWPLAAVGTLLFACGGQTISTSKYASTNLGNAKAWQLLLPGQRLALNAASGGCDVAVGGSFADLAAGGGTPLSSDPSLAGLHVFEIKTSTVYTGIGGFVGLEVLMENGSTRWLKLPTGKRQGCIQPAPTDLVAVRKQVGKDLVFTPWKERCTEVHAAGQSPAAMLLDAEGELALKTEGVVMGAASATDMAQAKPGNTLWLTLAKSTLKVRADTAAQCFSEAGSDDAKRPNDPLTLIRTPESRCISAKEGDRTHVECRTSLGVWEGVVTDGAVELRATRRTLGEIHFLDGTLVDGARFARTVVAVTTGSASDDRRRRLYGAMQGAMRTALVRSGSGVRVATPGSPDVTYSVHVEVGEVQIGELQTRDERHTSKYKVRDEVRDNPKKPAARDRVDTARDRLRDAEQDFQDRKADFDRLKSEARAECDRAAAKPKEAWARIAAGAGCAAADALIQPSDSDVRSARAELSEAEQANSREPATITVPIMDDWTYTKRVFTRAARGSIQVRMQGKDWPEPRMVTIPLAYQWQDYEVAPDPAHNVTGHSPDRGPINDPEQLVPYIAKDASQHISARIRAAVDEARLEQARTALAASGMEATKPGFETVDAMAFEMAGARLEKALLRGATPVGNAGTPLPTEALSLGAGECLTAAAVAAPGSSVILRSKDLLFADGRGGGFAVIEICHEELTDGKLPVVELASGGGSEVKWTLYRTRSKAGG